MGRSPCCDENGLKKGPWTPEEDEKLIHYIQKHGHRCWKTLPKQAGLNRCGKSCRLRWTNYLRPDIKRGKFSPEEEDAIVHLHSTLGNRWSSIAAHLPGRTDNDVKNIWHSRLKKRLLHKGIDPMTYQPMAENFSSLSQLTSLKEIIENQSLDKHAAQLQEEVVKLAKVQYLRYILQSSATVTSSSSTPMNCSSSITSTMEPTSLLNTPLPLLSPSTLPVLNSQGHDQYLPRISCSVEQPSGNDTKDESDIKTTIVSSLSLPIFGVSSGNGVGCSTSSTCGWTIAPSFWTELSSSSLSPISGIPLGSTSSYGGTRASSFWTELFSSSLPPISSISISGNEVGCSDSSFWTELLNDDLVHD